MLCATLQYTARAYSCAPRAHSLQCNGTNVRAVLCARRVASRCCCAKERQPKIRSGEARSGRCKSRRAQSIASRRDSTRHARHAKPQFLSRRPSRRADRCAQRFGLGRSTQHTHTFTYILILDWTMAIALLPSVPSRPVARPFQFFRSRVQRTHAHMQYSTIQ